MSFDTLEDLYLNVARRAQEGWDKDAQAVDLFNNHIMQVASVASPLGFSTLDYGERVEATKLAVSHLMVAMYAIRLLPPSEDDLTDMAEAMNVNIANDALLCTALISRGACDALLFFHEEDQQIGANLIRSIGEALSGVYLLCKILNIDLTSIPPTL